MDESECQNEDMLAALIDGQLAGASLLAARQHIARCSACRALWTAAVQAQPASAHPIPTEPPDGSGAAVAAPLPTPVLPRGTDVGRYVVLGVVGSGGMSVVYSAYDPDLDRKVALKFLRLHRHGAATDPAAQALRKRLQREAQAMARLMHPCVITVHDIGTFEGDVFIAMEFVDGGTLSDWCAAAPRPRHEILALFRRIGQGLAAAHRVGIVHRDFKPSNVLISRQGDVRITDFGLARLVREADDLLAEPHLLTPGDTPLLRSLTQPGGLLGTPAYMAPEQFAGHAVDARADQFSFCVALYEALLGERPFHAESVAELAQKVQQGDARLSDRLPAPLRRVLLRGLSREPAARYPSMDALVAALAIDPRQAFRRVVVGLGAAAVLIGAATVGYQARRAPALICRGAERKLAGIWDAARQQAAREAFLHTGRAFAADAWAASERALTGYAAGFVRMHTEACEATQLRAEQSEQLMDLRIGCLEQRRKELAAVTELFTRADAQVVERAQRIVAALPDLAGCADAPQLLLSAPPPSDPAVRARLGELEAQLARIRVQHSAGQYRQGLGQIQGLLPTVKELGLRRLYAEYLHTLGRLQESTSSYSDAEASYYQALWEAEAARHDVLAAQAWLNILQLYGEWKPREPQVAQIRSHAAAAIARAGSAPALLAAYHQADGVRQSMLGDQEAARAALQRALSAYEQASGPEHVDVARILMNLGTVYRHLGRFEDAVRSHQRALAIGDKLFGHEHPFTATIRTNLGNALALMGRPAEALPLLRHALHVDDACFSGPDMHTATTLGGLGAALALLGRYREAQDATTRDLQIEEGLLGKEHPATCVIRRNLGELQARQGRHDQALALYEDARRIAEKAYGPSHPEVASALLGLASEHRDQGRAAEALSDYRRAHAIYAQVQTVPEQESIEASIGMGESLLLLARPAEALPHLEGALAAMPREDIPINARLRAGASAALARALWALQRPGDRERALQLAAAARDTLTALGTEPRQLAQVQAWLLQHRSG
jgi:tetratricopeptide (TPR) repeat protein/tRNA A-37 threonylcarbamoyl transferase component Bud32